MNKQLFVEEIARLERKIAEFEATAEENKTIAMNPRYGRLERGRAARAEVLARSAAETYASMKWALDCLLATEG